MAKKLILVWLTLLMVLFSSISIYAEDNIQGDFFVKHVVINGEEIINYNLQYPFFLYENTLYIPLTPEIGEICGFKAEMDWESRTLKLLKTDSTRKNISSNWMKNNNEDISVEILQGATVLAYSETDSTDAGDEINSPVLSVAPIDMGDLPVLTAGNYVYLPLRAIATDDHFCWDIYFNPYYGMILSTIPDISAESYCSQEELLLNQGLVNYMINYNQDLSPSIAQNLLFFFKRAADVYDVDLQLLMSIGHKESNFNYLARSRGGAVGVMQIMPSTGSRYNLTLEDLYDPYKNINFGAMYISERIAAYGGDWEKGLSAYNQGAVAVNRGTYSRAYATRIESAYDGIESYLHTNGFIYYEPISISVSLDPIGPSN